MLNGFVQFDITPPLDGAVIRGHIAHALSLNLPEADPRPLKRLTVVANGPSAIEAEIKGDCLALNGALKLFTDRNMIPTYWAACDPQERVADFLPTHPPEETIYFVGSKCHPSVFEKLKGRDVRLWHIDDFPIPADVNKIHTASSITLTILPLMRRVFNYRAFDVYGWDGCFDDEGRGIRHHASDATIHDYPPEMKDVCVGASQAEDGSMQGGRWFKTMPVWMAEAQDALTQLHFADYEVTVHGDGLIKAMLAQTSRHNI